MQRRPSGMIVSAMPTLGRFRTIDYAVAPNTGGNQFAFHDQELQDCIVHALLQGKKGGTFIDLAANHWQMFSNTLSLERDHGWSGLCIEPNPVYHAGLMQNRTCSLVAAYVSESEGPGFFSPFATKGRKTGCAMLNPDAPVPHYCMGSEGKLLPGPRAASSLGGAVWTIPFERILEKHELPPIIDFLSLDVNGPEEAVMRSFPYSRHNVTVITIEGPSEGLTKTLRHHNYRLLCLVGHLDQIWVYEPSFRRDGAEWAQLRTTAASPSPTKSKAAQCSKMVFPHAPGCRAAQQALGRKYRVYGTVAKPSPATR